MIKGNTPQLYLGGSIVGPALEDDKIASRSDLTGVDLQHLFLIKLNLTRVYLESVNFRYSILDEANFIGTNLGKADFTGARLKGANLSFANLKGAIFNNANLRETKGLKQKQLDEACGNDKTLLPGKLSITSCHADYQPHQPR